MLASALIVVAAATAAYASSFRGVFVFDDEPSILDNPYVRTPWPITDAMQAPRDTTLAGRPTASLTFALNYAIGGDDPAGYHVFNLAIHILAALALFGVVRRTLMSGRLRDRFAPSADALALVTATIWAVHPLLTGSVTYIVQRVESLMGVFYLLTLYCAIRSWQHRGWAIAAVMFCALGMGTKEVMVTAPAMVVLWDALFGPEIADTIRRRLQLYLGLASTWIILALLVSRGSRSFSVGFGFPGWPWTTYLVTQAGVVLHYLRLAIVPAPLVLDYEWPPARSIGGATAPLAVVGILVALTLWAVWRRRAIAFPALGFFLILAPTSSVLPIVTEVAAEHRMYLPLAAVVAIVVLGGHALAQRSAPLQKVAGVTAAAVAVVFVTMTQARNRDYHDHARIWADTVQKRPANARARNNFASVLIAQGRYEEAKDHLLVAITKNPAFGEAHANLGVALCATGACEEGVRHLERAIELAPDYVEAHRNLGEAHASLGRFGPAVGHYLSAIELRPDDVTLLNRAAWILATTADERVRNGARALELAERAVRLTARQDVISLDTLAAALADRGRSTEAAAVGAEALALARAKGERAIVPELEQRVELYRAGQPFRQ